MFLFNFSVEIEITLISVTMYAILIFVLFSEFQPQLSRVNLYIYFVDNISISICILSYFIIIEQNIIWKLEQSMKLVRCKVKRFYSNYGIMMLVFLAVKMTTTSEGGVTHFCALLLYSNALFIFCSIQPTCAIFHSLSELQNAFSLSM